MDPAIQKEVAAYFVKIAAFFKRMVRRSGGTAKTSHASDFFSREVKERKIGEKMSTIWDRIYVEYESATALVTTYAKSIDIEYKTPLSEDVFNRIEISSNWTGFLIGYLVLKPILSGAGIGSKLVALFQQSLTCTDDPERDRHLIFDFCHGPMFLTLDRFFGCYDVNKMRRPETSPGFYFPDAVGTLHVDQRHLAWSTPFVRWQHRLALNGTAGFAQDAIMRPAGVGFVEGFDLLGKRIQQWASAPFFMDITRMNELLEEWREDNPGQNADLLDPLRPILLIDDPSVRSALREGVKTTTEVPGGTPVWLMHDTILTLDDLPRFRTFAISDVEKGIWNVAHRLLLRVRPLAKAFDDLGMSTDPEKLASLQKHLCLLGNCDVSPSGNTPMVMELTELMLNPLLNADDGNILPDVFRLLVILLVDLARTFWRPLIIRSGNILPPMPTTDPGFLNALPSLYPWDEMSKRYHPSKPGQDKWRDGFMDSYHLSALEDNFELPMDVKTSGWTPMNDPAEKWETLPWPAFYRFHETGDLIFIPQRRPATWKPLAKLALKPDETVAKWDKMKPYPLVEAVPEMFLTSFILPGSTPGSQKRGSQTQSEDERPAKRPRLQCATCSDESVIHTHVLAFCSTDCQDEYYM